MLAPDVATGCDLVTCSGDKLLGGCQAGLLLGRAELIGALRDHPLRRAVRVDKSTLAALDAVLSAYLAATALPEVPTIAALAMPVERLREQAGRLGDLVAPRMPAGWTQVVEPGTSSVGGGAYSTAELPTWLLRLQGPHAELEACHARLRAQDPAVLARLNQDGLAIDPRTLADDEFELVAAAFADAWASAANREGPRG